VGGLRGIGPKLVNAYGGKRLKICSPPNHPKNKPQTPDYRNYRTCFLTSLRIEDILDTETADEVPVCWSKYGALGLAISNPAPRLSVPIPPLSLIISSPMVHALHHQLNMESTSYQISHSTAPLSCTSHNLPTPFHRMEYHPIPAPQPSNTNMLSFCAVFGLTDMSQKLFHFSHRVVQEGERAA
jgi:hypothetical protein